MFELKLLVNLNRKLNFSEQNFEILIKRRDFEERILSKNHQKSYFFINLFLTGFGDLSGVPGLILFGLKVLRLGLGIRQPSVKFFDIFRENNNNS